MSDPEQSQAWWRSPTPAAARRAGDLVFAGGEGLVGDPDFASTVAGNPLFPYHGNRTERQLSQAYRKLDAALRACGSSPDQVMTINAFHADPTGIDSALKLRGDLFRSEGPPASTLVLVDNLPGEDAAVATDVIALADDAPLARSHLLTASRAAPLPVLGGIYGRPVFSQLVRGGGLIFSQGKGITAGPALGSSSHPQSLWRAEAQTELTLDYLATLLAQVGASLSDVVRAEITLNDPRDITAVDRVWRRRFPTSPPARVVLPARLALADTVVVEISLIAVDPDGPLKREAITAKGVTSLGWESPAVRAGPYVFMSSRYAVDAQGRAIVAQSPFVGALAVEEAERISQDVELLCVAAGGGLKDIVRRRSFMRTFDQIAAVESVWRDRLGGDNPPATLLADAGSFIVPGCSQAAEIIAWIP